MAPSRPHVLIADTNRWGISARLAIGLAEAGCEISAVCPPPSHALMKTRAVGKTFRYSGIKPLESLRAAIEAADPLVVIPSCDRSVAHLHELYLRSRSNGSRGKRIVELIERSLGVPASHSIVASRFELLRVAREEGIRVPDMCRVHDSRDLEAWRMQQPLPWVLKADGTWGGRGVRVVHSLDEVHRSIESLTQISGLGRALKRIVVNRDPFWIHDWWRHAEHGVIAQAYISGRPANCAVLCWKGRVLASIGVEVVSSEGATGPATVVRLVKDPAMMHAAEMIASRLQLSGFFGLDFMIETPSNRVFLIEMNPRLAPPCHLRLGAGRDLPGAFWSQLTERPLPSSHPETLGEFVSYFPQDSIDVSKIPNCYQDMPPENEPELKAELSNPFPARTILFRLVQKASAILSPPKKIQPVTWGYQDNAARDSQDDHQKTLKSENADLDRVPLS